VVPPAPVAALDPLGAASRPTLAAAGESLVLCHGRELRFHTVDAAIRIRSTAADIVAIARTRQRAAALDERGVLYVFDNRGRLVATRQVADVPRSLAVAGTGRTAAWLAIGDHGLAIVDGPASDAETIELAGALAAAADPDGAIVILASGRRLALWEHGELEDIPESAEQLVAIAPLGGRRFVCAGQHNLFVLDLAQRELDALYQQNTAPYLAASPSGKRIAWATRSSVAVANLAGDTLEHLPGVHYPETLSEPDDEPLVVRGLAFLDDDRLAVALQGGRGNILDVAKTSALKLDPQRGDPPSRWVFTFGGNILVAG
jgi:hypothetical protein